MPRARYERDGDVGQIVLCDPPLNLFGAELTGDLLATLDHAEGDMPRALIVRAEGDIFTGGADVNVFATLDGEGGGRFFGDLVRITHKLEDMPVPTIAVAHGLCLTAGLELSLACDLFWAGESARFGLVERVVGLTPGMGGTQRMAERAGPARAREFVMSGDLYDAATLERWNVINRVVPDDRLLDDALAFARDLAAGPTLAHVATKRVVRAQLDHGTRGADARIAEIAGPLFDSDDLQNAVRSFLEQGPGKATFEGR